MDINRYKRYLELGDEGISKRTAYRHRNVISPIRNQSETTQPFISSEIINDVIDQNQSNTEVEDRSQVTTFTEYDNDLEEYLHQILLEDKITYSSPASQNPKSLNDMIKDINFFKPLSISADVSQGELLLMVLKYCMSNNTSVSAMSNLCKMINTMFEIEVLPNSRYCIDQLFDSMDKLEFHAVCPNCTAYIGQFGEIQDVKSCHICRTELNLENPSNTSFFVLMDPSSQIRDLISIYQDHYEFVVKERVHESNCLNDIYDGNEYRKFVRSLPEQKKKNYLSAILNTDGANKFKCSQFSIWPLFLMINELPKQQRMSKLVNCGLWFNKNKPDMSVFLGTFVEMLNRITKEGIKCVIKGEERVLELHIINCCVDSVARAPCQGIKQFNGKCACGWCYHPGVWVDNAMKYPLLEKNIALRNHETTISEMMIATPDNPVNGIMKPSALINLPYFNIISGFVPDYMHCCLEGVAKQITEYHISSMNNDDITEINCKMNQITAPHQIAKLSRPISLRDKWKAREWENYILYYSAVVLREHLTRDHYYHWLLFVESMYILLQEKIDIVELNRADEMLHEFVAKTEHYFGQKAMTYNVHQLLHLSQSVLNWGPLWCHSTFSFESGNHVLLKAIKCSKGVTQQIIRHVKMNHTIIVLQEFAYPRINELVKLFCDDILQSRVQNCYKISDVTYIGKGENVDNPLLLNFTLSNDAAAHVKIIKDDCLYESARREKKRSNNSFVLLKDNRFARLEQFITDKENKKELTICNIVKTRRFHAKYYHKLHQIEEIEKEYSIVPTREIKSICIFLKISRIMYILPIPNLLHY